MGSTTLWIAVGVAVLLAFALVLALRGRGGGRRLGRVTVTRGPREGETFELVSGRTRIGALDDNDIVIPSKQVSRYHAELRARGSEVYVWDLRARNQTYVNGEPVDSRRLYPGDIITVGDAELRYDR